MDNHAGNSFNPNKTHVCKNQPVINRSVVEEFGLESVLRGHRHLVKTKADVCVVWLHYLLIRNLFKTTGGEVVKAEKPTETLPPNLGWSGEKRSYFLRYYKDGCWFSLGACARDQTLECSLVTVARCLKVGIPLNTLVTDDLTVNESVVDEFSKQIEETFVKPFTLRYCGPEDEAEDEAEAEAQ